MGYDSYVLIWTAIEGGCRKSFKLFLCVCPAYTADEQRPPQGRWWKAFILSTTRWCDGAFLSIAGVEAIVVLSLIHPRTFSCLPLSVEILNTGNRSTGKLIWHFSFQARAIVISLLFSSVHYQIIPKQLHFTDAKTKQNKIRDHCTGISETHWAGSHFTSKQNWCLVKRICLERQNRFLLTDEAWSPCSLILAFPWRDAVEQSNESEWPVSFAQFQPLCICLLTLSFLLRLLELTTGHNLKKRLIFVLCQRELPPSPLHLGLLFTVVTICSSPVVWDLLWGLKYHAWVVNFLNIIFRPYLLVASLKVRCCCPFTPQPRFLNFKQPSF